MPLYRQLLTVAEEEGLLTEGRPLSFGFRPRPNPTYPAGTAHITMADSYLLLEVDGYGAAHLEPKLQRDP